MEKDSVPFSNQDRKGRVKYLVPQIPKLNLLLKALFYSLLPQLCVCVYTNIILGFVSFQVIKSCKVKMENICG